MDKIGLVLEGGGMRGVYTAGVLDLFLDKDLHIPNIIGVSAGSCQAFSYISKQRGRSYKIIADFIRDDRYLSIKNLIKEKSIFGMDFMFDTIPNKLNPFDYATYKENVKNFLIVATNCITGEAEYFDGSNFEDMFLKCRASSSIPLLSQEVMINGIPYLDGGVADSIPIRKSIENGFTKNIIILTRNINYRKKPSGKMTWLVKKRYSKYKGLINSYENRYNTYNKTLDHIEQLEKEGKVFVIRPRNPIKVGRTEKNIVKLKEFYDEGYKDASDAYEDLMAYFKNQ